MTDEQEGLDPSLVKRKLSKRERFRGAVQRGVNKVKKSDEDSTRDGGFTLNDDVKDFLTFRSPYSKPTAVLPPSPESQKVDANPHTPPDSKVDIDDFLHKTDPADVLPHFPTLSHDPLPVLPVPRIDVAKSPRFPHARDLHGEKDNADVVAALRIQDDSGSPPSRKTRRKRLTVRFTDSPPILIGEGGDEAETPTIHLLQTRLRSRSDAPMSEPLQQYGQAPPPQIIRKPVASPAQHILPQHTSPQYISPQSLQSMEFDMTLTPSLTYQGMPTQSTSVEAPESPATRTRLRDLRAEEGKTMRENFHDASLDSVFD